MKTLSFAFVLTLIINVLSAQTASVDPSENIDVKNSTSVKAVVIEKAPTAKLDQYSLQQLNTNISQALQKNDLLRQNVTSASLVLKLKVDETGTLHAFNVQDSDSRIMSEIIENIVSKVNGIKTKDLSISGLTTIKIPVQYKI